MSLRPLVVLPFVLAACAGSPQSVADSTDGVETRFGSRGDGEIVFQAMLLDFEAGLIGDGELCSVHTCFPIEEGLSRVALDAGVEEEIVVELADGWVQHLQLVSGLESDHHVVTVLTAAGHADLAEAFGVRPEPARATVIQRVSSLDGITPKLDGADGPYFLSGSGEPLPEAQRTDAINGYYVFFDVPVAETSVQLPGCLEGTGFWGAPDDERIDIETAPGAVLFLGDVTCD